MTGPLIAPVIPPERPARGGRSGPRRGRLTAPPPLANPPPRPAPPPDLSYGIGRVDASGRVADRSVIAALGWSSGDRLTLTAESGVVIVRRDPSGLITLPPRPYLVIPAALRHRCGIRAGDLVLLAASPAADTLAAYPFALVDQALRAHVPFPGFLGGSQ
jgi:bifunctional DNA-binding transcriptional regulator/antitoxin component of YhaV-PrlF toxin-antitoxin module